MKSFALTSAGSFPVHAFYVEPDLSASHLSRTSPDTWQGSGALGFQDILGGIFRSTVTAVASLDRPPILVNPGRGATGTGTGLTGTGTGGTGTGPHPGPSPVTGLADQPSDEPDADAAPDDRIGINPIGGLFPQQLRLDVFGLGTDYAMFTQIIWGGVPSPTRQWFNMGGSFISTPTPIVWSGRIDVFGIGTDRAMYHKHWNGHTWPFDWERLGGIFTSEAAAVSWGKGRLDVFGRGSDYTLRHRTFDGASWLTDWENFGGSLASPPVAVSWGFNRLDIFAISDHGSLIHKWWDGVLWNEWEDLGFPQLNLTYVDTPSVVTLNPGRMDVFALGSDGILYQTTFDQGAWQAPVQRGSDCTAAPSAIVTGPGQMSLLKPTTNGKAMFSDFAAGAWGPWRPIPLAVPHLPCRFAFSVDEFRADTTRSLVTDTDVASSTLAIGNWKPLTEGFNLGDVGGTAINGGQILISFNPIPVELCEMVIFNYQILNSADPKAGVSLNSASAALAKQSGDFIKQALGAGFTAITSIEIGSISGIPVIGTILGLVANWLLGKLADLAFAQCDGLVALEQVVLSGKDLQARTLSGPWATTTIHPGTDSNTGCGSNSRYEVSWKIRNV